MKTSIKILNGIFFIAFVLFSYWQFNDPDKWIWISIYGYAAVVTLLTLFNVYTISLPIIGFIGYSFYILIYIFSIHPLFEGWIKDISHGMQPQYETAREFYGLVIVEIWMIVLFFQWRKFK